MTKSFRSFFFSVQFQVEILIFHLFFICSSLHYRKDCKRCVVIYEKHQNVLQYKESECELEQNKPASAAISSVIRSDYNTDSRFQGNEQYMDPESTYHIIFISSFFSSFLSHPRLFFSTSS